MSSKPPSLAERVVGELRATPLQVCFAAISATVSTMALYVAWRTGGSSFAAPTAPLQFSKSTNGYLVSFSALLAISTTAALIAWFTRKFSWVATYFGSMVYASAANFLITLIVRTQGVRFGSPTNQPGDTLWVIHAAVVITFAAVNGEQMLKDVTSYEQRTMTQVEVKKTTVGDIAFSVGVVVLLWVLFVRSGSYALSSGLLQR